VSFNSSLQSFFIPSVESSALTFPRAHSHSTPTPLIRSVELWSKSRARSCTSPRLPSTVPTARLAFSRRRRLRPMTTTMYVLGFCFLALGPVCLLSSFPSFTALQEGGGLVRWHQEGGRQGCRHRQQVVGAQHDLPRARHCCCCPHHLPHRLEHHWRYSRRRRRVDPSRPLSRARYHPEYLIVVPSSFVNRYKAVHTAPLPLREARELQAA
jgi:hypothetical protein